MASSIPAVSIAVYDGLKALAVTAGTLEGATVFYALASGEDPGFDQIIVADERDIVRTSYMGGQQQREEYVLPIELATRVTDHDTSAAKVRLMALVSAIEAWVKANRAPAAPAYSIDINGHNDLETDQINTDTLRVTTAVNVRVSAVVNL